MGDLTRTWLQRLTTVVGIGNAIVDIIARCDDAFLSKRDLDKGFMRLIDADDAASLYEEMGPATERSGGSVANSIAGLASFGASCGYIGRVAADQFGGIFRRHSLFGDRVHDGTGRRRRQPRPRDVSFW